MAYQGTNTYLIECSRENSKINLDDDEDTNGAWSNETSFNIKRGDRISVELVVANIRGSGTGAPTIEFSGQNVVVNGTTKKYCDTKVLIEVFFTMNNNNTYSVGLPLIHPHGGINGSGSSTAGNIDFENLVMPFNLNPRTTSVTNQKNNYREINENVGYITARNDPLSAGAEIPRPFVDSTNSYSIWQYKTGGVWLAPGVALTLGDPRCEAVRIMPFAAAQVPQAVPPTTTPTLYTDWDNGILKGRTGQHMQNNFYVGNHIFVSDMNILNPFPGPPAQIPENAGCVWIGQIESINGRPDAVTISNPAFGIAVLELTLSVNNTVTDPTYPAYGGRGGGGTGLPADLPGWANCASYVGNLHFDQQGVAWPDFNVKAGSSQEGLINYDNIDLLGIPFDNPASGATGRTYLGNGYIRGNNAHFLYGRNTRIPQTGQSPNFALFPNTIYNPTTSAAVPAPVPPALFTGTAGDYGDLASDAQFGYRNANPQEECNNDPYIFMRNDHFGSGRLGMNAEEMPKAEPMTAFIYITIEELLQDVNSLTAVINRKLNESLTGIGTTTRQTNKLLLNSLENPDGRQVASNVVPYYNKLGFYDKNVTKDTQNILMAQSVNAQFRNTITDIIPVKNGGTVKITPANGLSGRDQLACNYGKQYGGVPQLELRSAYANSEIPTQAELDNVKRKTYLREIETSFTGLNPMNLYSINGFNGWANPFYGNMATADLYKYLLGDRWARLTVNNCNSMPQAPAASQIRNVGKAIIMNTQLIYKSIAFPYPAGLNGYTDPRFVTNFPSSTSLPLNTNQLFENQIIYTNIEYPVVQPATGGYYTTQAFVPTNFSLVPGNLDLIINGDLISIPISINLPNAAIFVDWFNSTGAFAGGGGGGGALYPSTPAATASIYIIQNIPQIRITSDLKGSNSSVGISTTSSANAIAMMAPTTAYTVPGTDVSIQDEEKWRDLAKSMRKYETYYNLTSSAPTKFKLQNIDVNNWIYEGDIGTTDDRSTAQLRTMQGQPIKHPPGVFPDTGTAADPAAIYQNNRPTYYDWLAKPDSANIVPSATSTFLGATAPSQPGVTPATPGDTRTTSPGRSLLCPTMSHEIFAGISAQKHVDEEEKFRLLKQLGRIKLKSRFNPNWVTESLNYKGFPIINSNALPPEPLDEGFRKANDPELSETKIPFEFMKSIDLGFYPYTVTQHAFDRETTSIVDTTKIFCAIAVGTDYDIDYSRPATVNLGALCWGNTIGISNSFYDNHAIIPMNNDQVKRDSALNKTTVTKGYWQRIGFQEAVDWLTAGAGVAVAPTPAGSDVFTTTSVPPSVYAQNIWDFTVDRQVFPWVSPADSKCKYKITYAEDVVGNDSYECIWKQNTNLNSATNPNTPGNFEFISGDSIFTDTTSPGAKPFLGLMRNPGQNGSNNPFVLMTPTPNDVINGFPAWGCFICSNTPTPDPNVFTKVIEGHAPGLQVGGEPPNGPFTAWPLKPTCRIEIWVQPVVAGSSTPIIPNLGLEYNKVNYVWTGATKPTFQYNSTKGRVEFTQLQDDNILNVKSIPYVAKGAAASTAGSVGTKAAIINSASQDAVYSRNTTSQDFAVPTMSKPVRNSGVRAEISAVGIYNIYLCPEDYEPPPTINLSSYWSNDLSTTYTYDAMGTGGSPVPPAPLPDYWRRTEENRDKIIAGCIEADDTNWEGSLFNRLGFSTYRELLPIYGKQNNRYNPNLYNTTQPDLISKSSKPLILCNAIDNSIMPALNTYFAVDDITPPTADSINGVPMYSNGLLNNESVSIDVENQALTASAPPILSTSPFLLIESDICQTNWRSGNTQQNVLFYLMKNYQASSFIYGYGSSYTQTANHRTITEV